MTTEAGSERGAPWLEEKGYGTSRCWNRHPLEPAHTHTWVSPGDGGASDLQDCKRLNCIFGATKLCSFVRVATGNSEHPLPEAWP